MPISSTNMPLLATGSAVQCGCATAAAVEPSMMDRDLNDEFRRDFGRGRVVITAGVATLDETEKALVLQAVRRFNDFNPDNDPHGEHDFGRVEVGGEAYFWKIDCYDVGLEYGSPDPTDPAVTTCVLTIMRSDEY